ncbi:hypothetical protein CPLU01_14465 [Colletotrichum plurivorum]|uniref:Uncharacterized protein n=1 Tax=Colletotrichum plurivorum TaxID=2175906 RepID=A0A8H6JJA7_9PEZI|nr:hypothetical protein CPLU01_14465 [Colletotrichum plurivorum]
MALCPQIPSPIGIGFPSHDSPYRPLRGPGCLVSGVSVAKIDGLRADSEGWVARKAWEQRIRWALHYAMPTRIAARRAANPRLICGISLCTRTGQPLESAPHPRPGRPSLPAPTSTSLQLAADASLRDWGTVPRARDRKSWATSRRSEGAMVTYSLGAPRDLADLLPPDSAGCMPAAAAMPASVTSGYIAPLS